LTEQEFERAVREVLLQQLERGWQLPTRIYLNSHDIMTLRDWLRPFSVNVDATQVPLNQPFDPNERVVGRYYTDFGLIDICHEPGRPTILTSLQPA
jgi:hypothetical protein